MSKHFNLNESFNLQFHAEGDPEVNLITSDLMAKAREVDFVTRFSDGILGKLLEALGVTRKIPMQEGTTLYTYTTEGALNANTSVDEGAVIPLSKYERKKTAAGQITLRKVRKATSAEAIVRSGYDEAVRRTDEGMLNDLQKLIRDDFFTFLTGIVRPASGTEGQSGYVPAVGVSVSGDTLQAVLAQSWAQLQVLFENDAIEAVHFINPLTVADYLSTATITTQTAFGMRYIEDFLGMGTVILTSQIPKDEIYSTAKENLILYYLAMNGDVARSFNLTTDESGYIGIHTSQTDNRAQIETLMMTGISFLVEYTGGVVKGTVGA